MIQEFTCCLLQCPLSPFTHTSHHIVHYHIGVCVTGCGMDQRHQCATKQTVGMALFVASSRDTSTDEIKHPPNTSHIHHTIFTLRDMHNNKLTTCGLILTNCTCLRLLVGVLYSKHKFQITLMYIRNILQGTACEALVNNSTSVIITLVMGLTAFDLDYILSILCSSFLCCLVTCGN